MGISQAMNIGVSGLNSSSTALTVVGDNIANSNTTAYKTNSARFGDMVAGYYPTLSRDRDREGAGTAIMGIVTEFSQGSLLSTTRWSDVAINGEGFFSVQVPNTNNIYYTRDGGFHMDKDGYLVNELGYHVLSRAGEAIKVDSPQDAWYTNYYIDSNGQIWGTPTDPQHLTYYSLEATGSPELFGGTLYFTEAYDTTSFGDVTIAITDREDPSVTGTITLNSTLYNYDADGDGTNDCFYGTIDLAKLVENGDITWPAALPEGHYSMEVTAPDPNTDPPEIQFLYANMDPQPILDGQLRVSTFANNNGLIRQGSNLYTQGPESKFPIHGTAGDGIRGNLFSYTIEGSNVDIAKEMVNMITYQASYNANSKTITTAAALLDVAVNMVR
ncbi:MAG: flagellar hook-basal body complex protein [Thermodesulfobacteriota bacterium]|nr:flagellar hook-basal body complex protein [Thermodesulfobacteriota bacterium]